MNEANLTRSLEELEGERWPDPEFGSYLVDEAHRLRSVPIGRLTVEDLRLLLGQRLGTDWLVPLALEHLRADPLAAGDFYPGDLLTNVLHTEPSYWSSHPDELLALHQVRVSLEALRDASDRLLADTNWPAFG